MNVHSWLWNLQSTQMGESSSSTQRLFRFLYQTNISIFIRIDIKLRAGTYTHTCIAGSILSFRLLWRSHIVTLQS